MSNSIAKNVRRLRVLRNMDQGEVAKRAGISRNAYRAIETGASEPRVGNLQKIADALGVSIMELVREIPELHSLRFRSQKTMTAQQRAEREAIVARVAVWLRDFNELETMLGKKRAVALSKLPRANPEDMAQTARDKLGLHAECPIVDICDVLERAGIKLFQAPSALDKYSGLSVGTEDGGPAIAVNTSKSIPVERRIFSAAHELGHLLLHRDSYDGIICEEAQNDPEEAGANAFASYFLMPKDAFEKVWRTNRGLHFFDRVMKVKRHFLVSYKAVLRRLLEVGEVDKNIWKQFNRYYQIVIGKALSQKQEPFPLAEPDFTEDRLDQLVREALEKNLISIDRAAEILDVSVEQMRDRIQSWELAR